MHSRSALTHSRTNERAGRCHRENSGYTGTWYGFAPSEWNVYGPGGFVVVPVVVFVAVAVSSPQVWMLQALTLLF
jgi:hypothetical protein